MSTNVPRHQVVISFHEDDIRYKEHFVEAMGQRIVDRSVDTGNIDDRGLQTETVRQKIRDVYIRDATVTIVLIGPCTWQRKHVDWEIGSAIRKTRSNPRCGLLGILLPNHPNYGRQTCDPRLIPPRLADNCEGDDPYARIFDWPNPWRPATISEWIHWAFIRRGVTHPNNRRQSFGRNWVHRRCLDGWTD